MGHEQLIRTCNCLFHREQFHSEWYCPVHGQIDRDDDDYERAAEDEQRRRDATEGFDE